MDLKKFALRKGVAALLTIFVILAANFVIFRVAPGDPVRIMFSDPRVKPEKLEMMRQKFGLDKPIGVQFVVYLKELAKGNLGVSFWQKRPVAQVIAERVPRTIMLVVAALALAIALGVILGAFAGWRSGTRLDSFILGASLTMYSIPTFAMGVLLLLIFSYHLAILPIGGMSTPASGLMGFASVRDVLWHMILPVISIMIWYIGEYVLLTRSSMIDVMGQDYIETARAKGLKESRIL
ncbi:MAG: ABC transporter permease, partial [Desulfobacterales bacterium]|nr:ABC transporter permease [Desulfobacterales bacterium]